MQIDGGCHCGRITFRAEADPARVSICHCTDCQTLTGSPFRVTALTARARIDVTGEPKVYAKTGDNGGVRLQYFCPDCGTPIFTSGADPDGEWGIRWGSINQRSKLSPTRQIWCGSAAPWIDDLKSLPGRPRD